MILARSRDIFNKLKTLPYSILALIGGTGGTLAYWSAYKLNAVIITTDAVTSRPTISATRINKKISIKGTNNNMTHRYLIIVMFF